MSQVAGSPSTSAVSNRSRSSVDLALRDQTHALVSASSVKPRGPRGAARLRATPA